MSNCCKKAPTPEARLAGVSPAPARWTPGANVCRLPAAAAERFLAAAEPLTELPALAQLIQPAGLTLGPEGYALELAPSGAVTLRADGAAGLFYGAITLRQLVRVYGPNLPAGKIEDRPEFPERGFMLDVSRDKVPTLDTLRGLLDLCAEFKINQVELYLEHAFAYTRHQAVWAETDPLTGADLRALDAYARARFIELIPNQNSFGHFERWLKHPAYRDLAAAPEGFVPPWGGARRPPSTLDPTHPGALRLIEELYDELLPNFSSRQFNVGCDETWDLDQGRLAALCAARGKGRVYLDFLLQLYAAVTRRGRRMRYWGDIILHHPELIPELPADATALNWGYEADHPFDADSARFAAADRPFLVCPGTSSWNSLVGRTDNMLRNIRAAAAAGKAHGARGLLNTDWGDNGHWQYLPFSYPGLVAGAMESWRAGSAGEAVVADALNRHVFRDAAGALGPLVCALGRVSEQTGIRPHNRAVLFNALRNDPHDPIPPAALARAAATLEEAMRPLPAARSIAPDAALVVDEIRQAARMVRLALARAGGEPASADAWDEIITEHQHLWRARNREGGLKDSIARMLTAREAAAGN